MAGLLVDQGEGIALKALTDLGLVLHLFKNVVTPADTDTEALYTESTFTGYAPITLVAGSWSTVIGNPTIRTYPEQVFISSADQTLENVLGYYITTAAGLLVAPEAFGAAFPIQFLNDRVFVTPRIGGE